jgi:hypothetical protein
MTQKDIEFNITSDIRIYKGRMVSSGMLCHMALVSTYVSGELSASFIRVTRIG